MPMKKSQHTFSHGGVGICYELERKSVKNINLRVRRDGSVHVSAPTAARMECIDAFVRSKGDFILRALARFTELRQSVERQYVTGEVFRLLGRPLRLRVDKGGKNAVRVAGSTLLLQVQNPCDRALKERLLARFFSEQCRQLFPQLMARLYPLFKDCGFPYPELRIRTMRARWGSCMPSKQRITLNTRLICYPEPCIEYVIVHEFCHFRYPNHSRQFYAFMAGFMPDWKERRALL